ncbi:hypothetical protein Pmar_PMAR005012 [Perkinsus marinus ATCC 50983]|uniref:Uncharacterized protein n=1 Tax=Perkinsus marinus (strain ATCC 50983 / TXsc) TaxID=423536 RepID=C5LFN1_PERM5|nr:hypothetical protein Pmar_PMAR005012 [Perkinsus marinus ATCC 50983]EER04456.1 hypothetical protein Pmar_PMAR005012 [Perkinsus marinus ATCC 50983]|eukprot:XP_002772640.1 hypothetical protein Pmar_PMAR005012 [Perkinsus marinus ATCC 50983]
MQHSDSTYLARLALPYSPSTEIRWYYQERTRDHVVKVETKLIDLAEEFDEAKRRLKVSQREAKALAKENDRLTKMVAQMHAAIVESRAMLESSERRATAAEGLVAKLAVDKSGGERQASDGVLRSVDEQKSNIPSRFDQTSGDSQMGVNNEIDSGHPSGTTDLEEPSGGSTIAKLICELRELESEARSLLASQELDVSELAAQQQQQQQHKVN